MGEHGFVRFAMINYGDAISNLSFGNFVYRRSLISFTSIIQLIKADNLFTHSFCFLIFLFS